VWHQRSSHKELKSTDGLPKSYSASYGITIDGRYVFANMYKETPKRQQGDAGPFGFGQAQGHIPQVPDTILAYDIENGKILWSWREFLTKEQREEESKLGFVSNPIIAGDNLYVPKVSITGNEKETYVYCIDKRSGKTVFKTFISAVSGNVGGGFMGMRGTTDYDYIPKIIESEGVIYCQTNMGSVSAIDAHSGRILWLVIYKREQDKTQNDPMGFGAIRRTYYRPPNHPILYKGYLYCFPQDYKGLLIFDINDRGRYFTYSHGISKSLYILGLKDNKLLFLDKQGLDIVDLDKMDILTSYSINIKNMQGRPFLLGKYILIPVKENLVIFDLDKNRVTKMVSWEGSRPGNICVVGDYIISIHSKQISLYKLIEEETPDTTK
jgi:hypothetical protein